jgi:uroporphyrinogen-III synthase
MTKTVALFRAREDASASARKIRGMGFGVALLPATSVVRLAVEPPAGRFDAAIATSAKALVALPSGFERFFGMPLFVVGMRTARAARKRGWPAAPPIAPDAASLIATLRSRLPSGAKLIYLAGRDRGIENDAALRAAFDLELIELYAAQARKSWPRLRAQALAACFAALHYSPRSAAIAAELAEAAGRGRDFYGLVHVCLSADVAAPLRAAGVERIEIADRPDEAALLAALERAARRFRFPAASPI